MKEEKICSYTEKNNRLQLIRIIIYGINGIPVEKYQVRLNRKIIDSSINEYQMRKLFATYCQNIVLQLKIY